jgi:hypothetical protein
VFIACLFVPVLQLILLRRIFKDET